MRDRYITSKQHHRLVESHWDLKEDEFVNLSDRTIRPDLKQKPTLSSALLGVSVASLFAIILIKLLVDRTRIDKKSETHIVSRAKRRQEPSAASSHSSPLKRAKRMAQAEPSLNTTEEEISSSLMIRTDGDESQKEPFLVQESKAVDIGSEAAEACIKIDEMSTIISKRTTRLSVSKAERLSFKTDSSSAIAKKNKQQDIVGEALELAEKVRVTSKIFAEQGLDPKQAHDFVLRRHISDVQEQSRQDYENQKLAVECHMRSVELEETERRHRESIVASTQNDPNGLPKCLVARDGVLEFVINATAYLLLALVLDRLCQSGMDAIRSELFCECKNQGSWNSMVCALSPYICTVTPSCWVGCGTRWGSRIALGLGMRFLIGLKMQHTLPLVAGFVLWQQLQLIWYFAVMCLLVLITMYSMIMYRSHVVQSRLKVQLDQKKHLVDDYLIECDHVKMGITSVLVVLFAIFQFVEQGFLLKIIVAGDGESPMTL